MKLGPLSLLSTTLFSLLAAQATPAQAVVARPGKPSPPLATATGIRARTTSPVGATAPAFVDASWKTLAASGFHAVWDLDTAVPANLWFPSIAVPGSVQGPAIAERAARAFLDAHLGILAPGARAGDFEVVANVLRDDLRTVAFRQRAGGLRVLGGAIHLSFKRDNLFVGGAQALPHVKAGQAPARLDAARVQASAATWLRQTTGLQVTAHATGERAVLPLVAGHDAAGTTAAYPIVEIVEVRSTTAGSPGLWDVYVDARTGAALARRDRLQFADGTLRFDVGQRQPTHDRIAAPAALLDLTVDGVPSTTTSDGTVTSPGTEPAAVAFGMTGTLVRVLNEAGAGATATLSMVSGGTITFGNATDELIDAQASTYVYVNQVKAFWRAHIDPGFAYLDQLLTAHVNEAGDCNAFSDGDDIHFFPRTAECENTGRLADVVYHEFGHSLHAHALANGTDQFDPGLSEGLADYTAAMITGDQGMGRGFFYNDEALRELDPVGHEARYPEDLSFDEHITGEIISGALWDARRRLATDLGEPAGVDLANKLYYGIMQRAFNVQSSFVEALVADDDDGNLDNGTPHTCALTQAFGRHGLVLTPFAEAHVFAPVVAGTALDVRVTRDLDEACPAPEVASATIHWQVRGDAAAVGSVPMTGDTAPSTERHFTGSVPTQPDGTVVLYSVEVAFDDGTTQSFPQNLADPQYQMFFGTRQVIYCQDFEGDASDFTFAAPGGAVDWEVAEAQASASDDPAVAHGGTHMLGTDITADGEYAGQTHESAVSPAIDTARFVGVRLQYWRWLNVEDAAFDHAAVDVDGTQVFANLATDGGSTSHRDAEWRFQDVDIAAQAADGTVRATFSLDADDGLQFGGWNIDDVCVVGIAAAPRCGDGAVDPGEVCDDTNTVDGDGCAADCTVEEPETGGDGGGCCEAGGGSAGGAMALGMLAFGLIVRPRRQAGRFRAAP